MQLPTAQPRRRRNAFTLMEVLVVVAILVVLASIGITVYRYMVTGQEGAAKMQVKILETAVKAYHLKNGRFPDTLAELSVPTEGNAAYIKVGDLTDPWGHPYQYDPTQLSPTGEPHIFSQGSNPGQSKMISNWE